MLSYSYSCQNCQKWFKLPFEVEVIQNEYPLCSLKCLFRLIYRILSAYSQNDLDYLKNFYSIDKSISDNRQKLIFKITKKFINSNLSTIKEVYQIS